MDAPVRNGANDLRIVSPVSHITKGKKMADDAKTDDVTAEVDVTPEPIDASVYEAKISELTAVIVERDAAIVGLNEAIAAVKAHNYDLLMATPGDEIETVADEVASSEAPDVDDLFEK